MSDLAAAPVTRARTVSVRRPAAVSAERVAAAVLGVMMIGYGLFFGWLSLERYWAYEMHALDMGNMGQAAWNTVHGHPFYFTNMRLPYAIEAWNTTTRLSFHVEALFPAISLVYLIYGHPESLLILQTVALALGAIPTYLLARDVLRNVWFALVFVAAYLLFPTLQGMNLYEFHPVSLATPLLLFAFLCLWRRQTGLFVICSLLAMGTKEEIGLIVAMFGLYGALVLRQRRVGLIMAAVGILWSLTAVLVIEHHYRQPGTVSYVKTRYGYLGRGVSGALSTLIHHPGTIGNVLFIWPKLGYLERLLAPVGYLALIAPAAFLLGAPTLLLNLFSADFHMYSGVGDNSAELISVVIIAAILGTRRLLDVLARWLPLSWATGILGAYVLAQALWSQHANGFTPLGSAYQRPVVGAHQRLADQLVAKIPDSIAVSTQDQLDPHLSSRHDLYLFRDLGGDSGVPPAYTVLLDVSAPTYPLPSNQLHDVAQSLLRRGWGIAAADDGLILLETGLTERTPPAAFYHYAQADGIRPANPLHAHIRRFQIVGYSRDETDLPNHAVPNLAYTFYLHPTARPVHDVEPVVYETMDGKLINCASHPLGLDWYPTTRWKAGHTYAVRMDPIETNWNVPGTAHLSMELMPMSAENLKPQAKPARMPCQILWQRHGKLLPVGTLDVEY
jgi:uncharacterized membrane protein